MSPGRVHFRPPRKTSTTMLTVITVPTNFVSLIGANSSAIFTDVLPVVELIAGIAIALYVAGQLISYFTGIGQKRDSSGHTLYEHRQKYNE